MSSAPQPLAQPAHLPARPDQFDYEHLASLTAEKLVIDVANSVADRLATQVADLLASGSGVGPHRYTRERKRRERCRLVQNVITRLLKQGLRVSKLDHIGSDHQPDAFDLDGDDEGPWQIDWTVGPDHPLNRNIVDHWVDEVMRDKEMIRLHRKRKVTDEQFNQDFVRILLPHTFDTVRKFIKINNDESGRRAQRLKESKERSKRKERRRELVSHRQEIARQRTWHGKPIPEEFFKPEYHSDSENDPTPDLSNMYEQIPMGRYKELRGGADYEMLTPGWRSQDMTDLFHWLTKEYRASKGNRPQGSRYYHPSPRRFGLDDIPDGVPRCMIKNEVYTERMDDAKRALVGGSPEGW